MQAVHDANAAIGVAQDLKLIAVDETDGKGIPQISIADKLDW